MGDLKYMFIELWESICKRELNHIVSSLKTHTQTTVVIGFTLNEIDQLLVQYEKSLSDKGSISLNGMTMIIFKDDIDKCINLWNDFNQNYDLVDKKEIEQKVNGYLASKA